MTARMVAGGAAGGRLEEARDVRRLAEAILHTANLPLDAHVRFMTLLATKMPFVERGQRQVRQFATRCILSHLVA